MPWGAHRQANIRGQKSAADPCRFPRPAIFVGSTQQIEGEEVIWLGSLAPAKSRSALSRCDELLKIAPPLLSIFARARKSDLNEVEVDGLISNVQDVHPHQRFHTADLEALLRLLSAMTLVSAAGTGSSGLCSGATRRSDRAGAAPRLDRRIKRGQFPSRDQNLCDGGLYQPARGCPAVFFWWLFCECECECECECCRTQGFPGNATRRNRDQRRDCFLFYHREARPSCVQPKQQSFSTDIRIQKSRCSGKQFGIRLINT